jgi:hypothetical protein
LSSRLNLPDESLEYISAVRDRGSHRIGLCLDLTKSGGLDWVRIAYGSLVEVARAAGLNLPSNSKDKLRRNLDYAVVRRLHTILEAQNLPAIDTVKGVFTEGPPAYPGAGFREKTHIQIAMQECSVHQRCIPCSAGATPQLSQLGRGLDRNDVERRRNLKLFALA